MKFKPSDHIKLAIILSLTIGLAPFTPVPHSYQKLNWLFQGGNGMQTLDYFDLVLHNLPWLYLVFAAVKYFRKHNT
ncbi:hypothetical protein [Pedobacter alpinus]|uniref:RND transporter n=1 Tax=Pedobacter alpinus TaxID=1590643 RepID=A0ABW5TWF5_9SPHI